MSEFVYEVKQKTKIKISIYGQVYELHKPTVDEAKVLAETKQDGNQLEMAKDFMATLGLPKEISGSMEVEHFNLLLNAILDARRSRIRSGWVHRWLWIRWWPLFIASFIFVLLGYGEAVAWIGVILFLCSFYVHGRNEKQR